jgi:hypothetical protein
VCVCVLLLVVVRVRWGAAAEPIASSLACCCCCYCCTIVVTPVVIPVVIPAVIPVLIVVIIETRGCACALLPVAARIAVGCVALGPNVTTPAHLQVGHHATAYHSTFNATMWCDSGHQTQNSRCCWPRYRQPCGICVGTAVLSCGPAAAGIRAHQMSLDGGQTMHTVQ